MRKAMGHRTDIPQIGCAVPRSDALDKLSGQVRYAADYYDRGFLWAGVKRAGVPHAEILAVHTDAARKVEGVRCVLTAADVRGTNRQGVVRKDQPVLADDRVRHCGDGLALVVARDRRVLREALNRVTWEGKPLRGVFDPEEAILEGAPLIHEAHAGGNILLHGCLERGEVETAFGSCRTIVEAVFETASQEHAYLETECGQALLKDDGGLEIVVSTQTPFRDRAEVAEALGIETGRIRIIAPYCGGAFGGKDGITVQSLLALAALHCPGQPVKMWWDREESILASVKRHPAKLYYRLGAGDEGIFSVLDVRIYYDTGPYDHLGGAVMALGLEHAGGPYRIPNTRLRAWSVYTNNPVGGAFRAFGVAQVHAAMEQAVDMLAERLGMSPLEIRKRNAVRRGDKNVVGITLSGATGCLECLETLERHPLWKKRSAWKNRAGPDKLRGVGIAAVMHAMGYGPVIPDTANAKIELMSDGRFRVYCGVVDMGQGNVSTCLQMAGDLLNQNMECLEAVLPDTSRTLPSGSATASRTTYTFGNALIGAADLLKGRLLARAADLLMAAGPGETALVPGAVRHLPSGRDVPLSDLARFMDPAERTATWRFRAPAAAETVTHDPNLRLHGIPHLLFSYGAHLVRLEVDRLTGAVRVDRYLAVSECGRIVNPQIFEQQIQGAVAQGLGYALYEELKVREGTVLTSDLTTYIIPMSLDVPEMVCMAVEIPESTGPFGLKGAGEIGMDGPLPAVANALADACGIRIFRSPFTPEKVLAALGRGDNQN